MENYEVVGYMDEYGMVFCTECRLIVSQEDMPIFTQFDIEWGYELRCDECGAKIDVQVRKGRRD